MSRLLAYFNPAQDVMKKIIVLVLLLVTTVCLTLTRGLPRENDLVPHASASSSEYLKPNERVIPLGANMARAKDEDIRIIQRGDTYVLRIQKAEVPVQEFELKPESGQNYRVGM